MHLESDQKKKWFQFPYPLLVTLCNNKTHVDGELWRKITKSITTNFLKNTIIFDQWRSAHARKLFCVKCLWGRKATRARTRAYYALSTTTKFRAASSASSSTAAAVVLVLVVSSQFHWENCAKWVIGVWLGSRCSADIIDTPFKWFQLRRRRRAIGTIREWLIDF